jgi:hypothetical protein
MKPQLPPPDVLFHEEQQFRQPWIWALLLLTSAATFSVIFTSPSFGLAVTVLLLDAALLGFMYSLKLTTEVRQDGIYIRFFPMFRQTIPMSQLSNHYARSYRPIREFGGWGVRYGWQGKAYNVRGNRGVQLELAGGKRLLIGSQRPEEMALAVAAARSGSAPLK